MSELGAHVSEWGLERAACYHRCMPRLGQLASALVLLGVLSLDGACTVRQFDEGGSQGEANDENAEGAAEAQAEEGEDACLSCLEETCPEHLMSCQEDPLGDCVLSCVLSGELEGICVGECGLEDPPGPYHTVHACAWMLGCEEACPWAGI